MWFVVLLVIAIIPAAIAKSKGKNFGLWYLYGVCLWIVALIHAIVLKEDESQTIRETLNGQTQKKCPYCAEFIKMEAKVCRFCGKDLPKTDDSINDQDWKCFHCGTSNYASANMCLYCGKPRNI